MSSCRRVTRSSKVSWQSSPPFRIEQYKLYKLLQLALGSVHSSLQHTQHSPLHSQAAASKLLPALQVNLALLHLLPQPQEHQQQPQQQQQQDLLKVHLSQCCSERRQRQQHPMLLVQGDWRKCWSPALQAVMHAQAASPAPCLALPCKLPWRRPSR